MIYPSSIKNIDVNAIFEDVLKIIDKYAGTNENIDIYTAPTGADKGFYLIFIKRDETLPEHQRIIISTFGQHMNIMDLAGSLTNIIQQTIDGSNKTVHYS